MLRLKMTKKLNYLCERERERVARAFLFRVMITQHEILIKLKHFKLSQ